MADETRIESQKRDYKSLAILTAVWIAVGIGIGAAFCNPAYGAGIVSPLRSHSGWEGDVK